MENLNFYLITYRDPKDNSITKINAKSISDSNLGLGFIKISDFLFNTEGLSIINPTEEKLMERLKYTKSLHLSIYSILSVEEMGLENKGLNFIKDKSNLVIFPSSPIKS